MACDHTGPQELIEMAERDLRARGLAAEGWDGRRFRWNENTDGGFWAAVSIEVERRGDDWVVVKLDRSNQLHPVDELGFREIAGGNRSD